MKVLIDISEKMFKATQTYYSDNTTRLSIKSCIEKIANGTPIPDNATNGDVMLAIFKEIQHYSDGKICADWWNAPYKRGSEDGSN